MLGGTFTPHCAALHPARLVQGLAEVVRRLGRAGPRGAPASRRSRRGVVRTDARRRPRRRGHPGDGGLHRRSCPATRRDARAALLADGRHRTAARATSWDAIGLARPGDVQRQPAPAHLRPAHRRRPHRLRRARRAVPLRLTGAAELRRDAAGARHAAPRPCAICFPARRVRRVHARLGRQPRHPARLVPVGRFDRATGLAWPAATSATAWRRPTWPAARSPTSSPDGTRTCDRLPWVDPRSRRAGSPSRCAGSGSTPAPRSSPRRTAPSAQRPPVAGGVRVLEGAGPLTRLDAWPAVAARLHASRSLWLTTSEPGSGPHAVPVWGAVLDGVLHLYTSRRTRKARNVAAEPEGGPAPARPRGRAAGGRPAA